MTDQLLTYLLQSAAVLTVLYIPFQLLLRKEHFYALNRAILLGIMILSLVLPLNQHSLPPCIDAWLYPQTESVQTGTIIIEDLTMAEIETVAEETSWLQEHWMVLMTCLWALGAVFFFGLQVKSLVKLHQILHGKNTVCKSLPEGNKLFLTASEIPSFSWMRNIVMSVDDYEENGATILAHERAHIAHRHSLDKLLLMWVECIQWWNPFVWLMADALSQVHEYEADLAVISNGTNVTQYQLLLIRKAAGPAGLALVNGFKHNKLKLRIVMMNDMIKLRGAKSRYLALLPMMLLAIAFTARADNKVTNNPNQYEQEMQVLETDDDVLAVCEVEPMYPGGTQGLMKYIAENVRYPAECAEKGIEGRVTVSFIIEKDGSASNVKSVNSPNELLSEEAIRVISSMSKWEPGKQDGKPVRIRYFIPVSFYHDKQGGIVVIDEIKQSGTIVIDGVKKDSPKTSDTSKITDSTFVFIDDMAVPFEELKEMKSDEIESMQIIKEGKNMPEEVCEQYKEYIEKFPEASFILVKTKK